MKQPVQSKDGNYSFLLKETTGTLDDRVRTRDRQAIHSLQV